MSSALNAVRANVARSLPRSRFWGRYLHTTASRSNIVTSPVPDLELPTGNVAPYIFDRIGSWGHHIATECSVTGRRYTFSELMDGASRWAGILSKMGMQKGDVAAAVLSNCPEYPVVMLGSMMAGVTLTTVNPSYTAEEILRQLNDSEAKMVVYDPAFLSSVDGAIAMYKRPLQVVCNGASGKQGVLNLQEVLRDSSISFTDPVELTGEEVCMMPYSSGTTGPPKGVAVTHNAMLSNIAMYMHPTSFFTPKATATTQESYLGLLPLYHIYGILPITLAGLAAGVNIVTLPKFDPNTFVDIIVSHKMSTLHIVPPLLNFLLHSPAVTPESMTRLEHVLIGAAPVLQSASQSFMEKIKKDIFFQEGYGMTEVLISHTVPTDVRRVGTCGRPLPNVKVRVVDTETGEDLKAHQDGELWIKTPSMMAGYFKNPAATAETIDSDGWLHTGDVGHYDDDGLFTIVDRTKELIKVKGLQVSPSELEDVLRQCPGVVDVGVLGVPNDRLGEAPRAYVVTSKMMSEEQIHSYLENRVAPHKKLAGGICFIQELPKSPTGKLLRRELKRMSLEGSG